MKSAPVLSLPKSTLPRFTWHWKRFERQLRELRPGVVVCQRWEKEHTFGDDYDVENADSRGRAAIIALLVPGFVEALSAQAAYCDDEEDASELRLLRYLQTKLGDARESQTPISRLAWEIDGWGMAWGGEVELWTKGEWRVVTATYERESWGDCLPVLLGFVHTSAFPTGVTSVIRATVGQYVSLPNRITQSGLTTRDAVLIGSGLGRWEPQLLSLLGEPGFGDWAATYTDRSIYISHLERDLAYHVARNARIEGLDARFARVMEERRREPPAPGPLPLDRPVDRLSDAELRSLQSWFDAVRARRLRAVSFRPGQRYRYGKSPEQVVLQYDNGQESVPFPGALQAPTVGELILALSPERAAARPASGESTIEFADYLWARGFREAAEPLYKEALAGSDQRAVLAAAGHSIAEGRCQDAEPALLAVVERCNAARQSAMNQVSTPKREGQFIASLATERDAQRALTVLYYRQEERAKCHAHLARWSALAAEFGEGVDPFLTP